jgi:hypothetical protein
MQNNKNRLIKRAVLLSCVAVASYAVLRVTLNAQGFCWEDKRWLSDADKIVRVLEFVNQAKHIQISADQPRPGDVVINDSKLYSIIPYDTVADLLEKNPACCRIVKPADKNKRGFVLLDIDTANERFEGEYNVHYSDLGKQNRQKKIQVTAAYNNCGHTNNWDIWAPLRWR